MKTNNKLQTLKDLYSGKAKSINEALRMEQPLFSDNTESGLWPDLDKQLTPEEKKQSYERRIQP